MKFTAVSAIAFTIAFLVYLVSWEGILNWLYYSEEFDAYWNRKWETAMGSLQEYVRENQVGIRDLQQEIGSGSSYHNMFLYFEKYDSADTEYWEGYRPEEYGGKQITCRDGIVYAYARPTEYYENVGKAIALGLAALCFFVILIPFFLRVLKRITRLSREMDILAGGELSYKILSPGRDELAELGRSIEGMRCSVLEQMERENRAVLANSSLITSLSHDLRTPLTKLLGYLEIMKYGKCGNESEKELYLEKAIDKAKQMQVLSDEMFRYFQVGRKEDATGAERKGEMAVRTGQNAETDSEWELVSGPILLSQMLADQSYDLEKEGFVVKLPDIEGDFRLLVKVEDVRRIFDNIFSNLRKYADAQYPVLFSVEETTEEVRVVMQNHVRGQKPQDSRGIGLPTVRSLLSRNSGRLEIEETGKMFCMTVAFCKQ